MPCNLGDAGEHEGLTDGRMRNARVLMFNQKSARRSLDPRDPCWMSSVWGWKWSLRMTFTRWMESGGGFLSEFELWRGCPTCDSQLTALVHLVIATRASS